MMNTKAFYGLIVLLLLSGCAPETPSTVGELMEPEEDAAVPALATADVGEASTEEPPAESAAVATAVVSAENGSYPAPAAVAEEAYPAADEAAARQAAGGYPAENTEMMDEPALADADVLFVKATEAADGSWTFAVTVEHPDTGWEDYADGWDVITTEGEVLKVNEGDAFTRVLLHPHENEQPFTRSQSGLVIPDGVTEVFVRAHDIVHGWGGEMVFVDLTTAEGQNYEVVRYEE